MALEVSYESQEFSAKFSKAYVRIIEGSFDTKVVNLLVGVYASESVREKEKEVEDSQALVDAKNEEIFIKDQEMKAKSVETLAAEEALKAAQVSGLSQEELDAANNLLSAKYAEIDGLAAEKFALGQQLKELKAVLDNLPKVKPLEVSKYTFPMSNEMIEAGALFPVLYGRLKQVPAFSKAKDI